MGHLRPLKPRVSRERDAISIGSKSWYVRYANMAWVSHRVSTMAELIHFHFDPL